MLLVEKIVGNSKTEPWASRLSGATIDVLELTQWEAQKNLLRKETRGKTFFAIALERGKTLCDGDILFWDELTKKAVVCRVILDEVMEIDVRRLMDAPRYELCERCIALGHALGNQHWPTVFQDGFAYVPLTVNRLVMQSVMNTHHFKDISFRFITGEEAAARLEPAVMKRLFGGTGHDAHSHKEAGHNHDTCHCH